MVQLGLVIERPIIRAGLAELLKSKDFNIQQSATLAELLQASDGELPEILLVTLPRNPADIGKLMMTIGDRVPLPKVVFLSTQLDMNLLRECFAAGAAGFLMDTISPGALQKSLTLALAGEKVFPSELASLISDPAGSLPHAALGEQNECLGFSDREKQILMLLASGYSNKVIAANLDIAESTAKLHISSLLRKLRATNRTQAALKAIQNGLVTSERSHDYPEAVTAAAGTLRTSRKPLTAQPE